MSIRPACESAGSVNFLIYGAIAYTLRRMQSM